MFRKEVNEKSPLRILESSIHGGLGKGNLGVVMARAGVGKTAFLVQIGLDDLLRERKVLHVALGNSQTIHKVTAWYDALFDDLAAAVHLQEPHKTRQLMTSHRLIQTYKEDDFKTGAIEKALKLYSNHLEFTPDTILIDGFNWEGSLVETAASLGALKGCAERLGSELWISAQTHRDQADNLPCSKYLELIDVALLLEPKQHHAQVCLLKDHGNTKPTSTVLQLQMETMRLVDGSSSTLPAILPAQVYTLLSGGARGSEDAFGRCAETWGLTELNFSFKGRPVARDRGIIILGEDELLQGDVNARYLQEKMHRNYPDTPLFRKVLQSIWHQVNTASQVFVVGQLLPDKTVKGGTGWAAELARHLEKELHVYDQDSRSWFVWENDDWKAESSPMITASRFTGTGSRLLSDHGQKAIIDLFQRSFGDAPASVDPES